MQYLISSKTMPPERTKVASSTCADETLLIKHLLCRSDPLCTPAAYVQVSLRSVCQQQAAMSQPKAGFKSVQKPFESHPPNCMPRGSSFFSSQSGMHVNKFTRDDPFKWVHSLQVDEQKDDTGGNSALTPDSKVASGNKGCEIKNELRWVNAMQIFVQGLQLCCPHPSVFPPFIQHYTGSC